MSRPTLDKWIGEKLGAPFSRTELERYQLEMLNATIVHARENSNITLKGSRMGALAVSATLKRCPSPAPRSCMPTLTPSSA